MAVLGPWGRVRYWFGRRLSSWEFAYEDDRAAGRMASSLRPSRAWLLLFPALFASERVYTLPGSSASR